MDHSYADPNFSTALLRKDLRLFLEEATTAGIQDQGLSGLLSLLEQAKGTELDEQDYCALHELCLLYTSPSPRDATLSRMPSSA